MDMPLIPAALESQVNGVNGAFTGPSPQGGQEGGRHLDSGSGSHVTAGEGLAQALSCPPGSRGGCRETLGPPLSSSDVP